MEYAATLEEIALEAGCTVDEYLYDQFVDDQISYALDEQGGYL